MKALQISTIFGLLLALFADVANGFHVYGGPSEVYNARAARWPSSKDVASTSNGSGFLSEPDFYTIISYLNDVGRRRR